jgi:heme/copper-type cytochrome/quinol oxidase subunit 3
MFLFSHFTVLADVNGAFDGITKMLVSYLPAILTVILVLAGYHYMFALDDHNKATQSKRAIGVAIVGAIVVALAATIAPTIITSIGH